LWFWEFFLLLVGVWPETLLFLWFPPIFLLALEKNHVTIAGWEFLEFSGQTGSQKVLPDGILLKFTPVSLSTH
jgi:hypothetical protein